MKYRRFNLRYECLFFLSRFLFGKRIQPPENCATFRADTDNFSVLSSSTNNVVVFRQEGVRYYFRECKKHDDRRSYVRDLILRFFSLQSQAKKPEVCDEILAALAEKKSFFRFFYMGFENDKTSPLSYFQRTGDASAIGLDGLSDRCSELLQDLARFVWGDLIAYRLNSGLPKGSFQSFHASRNLSTYRIASLFFPSLVPETRFAFLITPSGRQLFGTVMNASDGIDPENLVLDGVTAAFCKELLALHTLDILTHERDHRPGNYFVRIKGNKADGVSAIDNDAPMTLFPSSDVGWISYLGCSPLVIKQKINRPFYDWDLREKLAAVSDRSLYAALSDLLSPFQIRAIIRRKNKLLSAIDASAAADPHFLTNEYASSDADREAECSGTYGQTYLSLFLDHYVSLGGQK